MFNKSENGLEQQIACYRRTIEVTVRTKLHTYWNSIFDLRTAEEDIIENVYERVIRLLGKFPEKKLNSAYLQKVVNSCVVNYYQMERKHNANRISLNNEAGGGRSNEEWLYSQDYGKEDFNLENISEASALKDYLQILYGEIDRLSEQDRALFIMYRYHGKSMKEISALTGLKENNIKVRLFRIRSKLAKAVLGDSYRPFGKSGRHICN